MTQMEASAKSPISVAGQRRPRPHSYTTQACDRCRSRKQRCVLSDSEDNTCRNCVESGSDCVFARSNDKSKRSRGASLLQIDGMAARPLEIETTGQHSVHLPEYSTIVDIKDCLAAPDLSQHPIEPMSSSFSENRARDIARHEVSTSHVLGSIPAAAPQSGFDWQLWLSSLTDQDRVAQHQSEVLMAPPVTPVAARASGSSYPPNTENFIHALPLISPPTAAHIEPDPLSRTFAPPHSIRTPSSAHLQDTRRHPISPASGMDSDDGSLEEAAKGLAMISLEAAAEPHYVGESSGSLWSTLIRGGMESRHTADGSKPSGTRPTLSSRARSKSRAEPPIKDLRKTIQQLIPDETAIMVLETVYRHLHPRYPFMDWVAFERQWERRNEIFMAVGQCAALDKESSTAAFFVLMVLAIGGQLCAQRKVLGLLRAEDYYELASPYLNVIVTLHNLANIQGLLLLAIYSLRDSKGPSVWYLSGVTMRLCVGMGLHRNAAGWSARNFSQYEVEMRKRVFWSCYIIDRMMALLLGRPPGISDDDFDVGLPEVYESIERPKLLSMQNASMVSAIHHIKLKQIESGIQRAIYSLNRQGTANDYWQLLKMLEHWEKSIPVESSSTSYWTYPSCPYDWFLLKGVEARLHLLRPLCAGDHASGHPFVTQLAIHAARGCEIQKRMHQHGQPMSNASAHSIFTCGMALLYANFLQPTVMPLRDIFRGVKAASNTLFAYAQHSRSAAVLYDVFEDLSSACIEHVSKATAGVATSDQVNRRASVDEWQRASSQATSNIEPAEAVEHVDLLQSWGITLGGDRGLAETLWDPHSSGSGDLLSTGVSQESDIFDAHSWR